MVSFKQLSFPRCGFRKVSIGILLIMVIACSGSVLADTFNVKGIVKDKLTNTMLFGAKVKLLNPADSSIVAEGDAFRNWFSGSTGNMVETKISEFNLPDIDRGNRYILQITREGYEPYYGIVNPAALSNKLTTMELGDILMSRLAKKLDEVVVTATKVKFYNKGDTLIYNADAFNLAEGSMLDALIRQLPGAELDQNGRITINGRFVESLLLNGKDFFKGNNTLMLENLGAYTVKNIAVYDRQDDMDKLLGDNYGKKIYTMDVRLKKEYNQGLLTNLEGGYGTSDRYLGKLFALWYADHARLSVYGNANNLSDNRKPGQDTGFTPANMNSGDYRNYSAGVDYWAEMPARQVSFSGNVAMDRTVVKRGEDVYTTNFLQTGDTYGYSFSSAKLKSWNLSTYHDITFLKNKWNMKISPSFSWCENNNFTELTSATFSREWDGIDSDFISSVYKSSSPEKIASLINRHIDKGKEQGHSINGKLQANGKVKMPNGTDAVSYLISGDYRRKHFDRFQRFMINFGDDPEPADKADRYFRNRPDYEWNASGALGYIWVVSRNLTADLYYKVDHKSLREASDLFRLDRLYDDMEDNAFGWLPSAFEYESTIDPSNSFDSRKNEDLHTVNTNFTYSNQGYNLYLTLNIPWAYRHQWLHYMRGSVDSRISRDKFFIGDVGVEMNWSPKIGWIYLAFNRRVTSPNTVDMVDMRDDLNPLEIRSGNPGLKDTESHDFRVYLQRASSKIRMRRNYGLSCSFIRNALAYGYVYDNATGVKTGKMYNVDGNWSIGVSQGLEYNFGSKYQFMLSTRTSLNYARSVDMLGENGGLPSLSKVNNYRASENISLDYSFANCSLSVFGNVGFSRFTSRRKNFADFNMTDFQYGLRGNFRLPYNFGISTDFTVYSRRGYSDSALNSDNFVWNARLSYSMLKGNLIFMADGFDILHNLSNIFYSVNAQARTETYTNVLPRYFMFHIQWKFHKSPKNKR